MRQWEWKNSLNLRAGCYGIASQLSNSSGLLPGAFLPRYIISCYSSGTLLIPPLWLGSRATVSPSRAGHFTIFPHAHLTLTTYRISLLFFFARYFAFLMLENCRRVFFVWNQGFRFQRVALFFSQWRWRFVLNIERQFAENRKEFEGYFGWWFFASSITLDIHEPFFSSHFCWRKILLAGIESFSCIHLFRLGFFYYSIGKCWEKNLL